MCNLTSLEVWSPASSGLNYARIEEEALVEMVSPFSARDLWDPTYEMVMKF